MKKRKQKRAGAQAANTAQAQSPIVRQNGTAAATARVRNPDGRPVVGLYPQISRKLMAEMTGLNISTVSGMLIGRTRVSAATAGVITRALGISLEELVADLAQERERWLEKQKEKHVRRYGKR